MDLATLNAFIAIAELGSFSEAAERLHLTQPAVSKRIASLEQQLGVRLFDRLGREIGLTEAGRALLPRAYQILNVLDDTRRALTNLSGEVSGRLTLATSHHIGLHRLPPLLRTFTHHIVQGLFEAQGLTPNIAMSTNYLETIKMMVSIGLAWSVLPRTMLDDQVARLPLPGIQLTRQLGYISHTERTLSNAARAFMTLLDSRADSLA